MGWKLRDVFATCDVGTILAAGLAKKGDPKAAQLGFIHYPAARPLSRGVAVAGKRLGLSRTTTPVGADMLDTTETDTLVSVHKHVVFHALVS